MIAIIVPHRSIRILEWLMADYSKDSLQLTLNLIPAHVWYADSSGALTFVNEQCADYLGVPPDHPLRFGTESHMASDSHVAFVHPDDHDETRRNWSGCIASRTGGDVTFRIRNAEGRYRWFLSRAEPRWTSDGELQGWVGINLDIEEQRRAEFYLKEGQRLANAGSWAFGRDGFDYWSPSLFQIHGIARLDKGPNIAQYLALIHPDDRDSATKAIEAMLGEHHSFDLTKRIVRPDGVIRHIRCVGTPASDDRSNPRFVGIAMDVTEREKLVEDLRTSETEFKQIVDLATNPVGVMSVEGARLYANRATLEYLGVTLSEWLDKPSGYFNHPDDPPCYPIFQSQLPAGQGKELEMRFLGKDGKYRWFLSRYNPLHDENGRIIRWYIAYTDIDDRKRTEERLKQENVALREEIDRTSMFEEIVGSSSALNVVLTRVAKVATSDSTILVTGETGTGKELVARAIHRRSRRASGAFIAVNCAAIPKELIASELFGHEKGAFTGAMQRRIGRFELADGGTIFLDEIGELSLETQVLLLRVLQEREFERVGGRAAIQTNVRIIAATNRDLQRAVADGGFREDLFYRLNVFPVEMPPLRERKEDIHLLVRYFVDRFARNEGKAFKAINKRTMSHLESYRWPGNVRELQNVIERSVIVCDSEEFMIDKSWLAMAPFIARSRALPNAVADHEKAIIEEALRACHGRVYGPSGAATRLGLSRSTLESKIRALKIDKSRFHK